MIGLLMKLLSPQTRTALQLAQRLTASLDTPAERKAAIDYCITALADHRITAIEWTKLGKALKVYGKK